MPDGINISLDQVSQTAGQIATTNASLTAKLKEIQTQMNGLSSWESDAGASIRERFNALSQKFDQYNSVIESYAKFLNSTVDAYRGTEDSLKSAADSFKA